MSAPQTPDEPSMEEILASIRRIISEQDSISEKLDDKERKLNQEAESVDDVLEVPEPIAEATADHVLELSMDAIVTDEDFSFDDAPLAVPSVDTDNSEQSEVNDVLNQLVGKAPAESVVEKPFPAASTMETEIMPEPEPQSEPDIATMSDGGGASFETTQDVSADSLAKAEAALEEMVVSEAEAAAENPLLPSDDSIDDALLQTEAPQDSIATIPQGEPPRPQTNQEESLVSDATTAATVAALSSLTTAISQQPISRGMTVEELVRDMMRPMMKEWLDANLPTMVEKAVKTEIERIVRNAFKQA